jgi:hypothetical protein
MYGDCWVLIRQDWPFLCPAELLSLERLNPFDEQGMKLKHCLSHLGHELKTFVDQEHEDEGHIAQKKEVECSSEF